MSAIRLQQSLSRVHRGAPRAGLSRARLSRILPVLALLVGALSPFAAAPARAQQTVTLGSNFGPTTDTSAGLSTSNFRYQAQGFGMSDGGARAAPVEGPGNAGPGTP